MNIVDKQLLAESKAMTERVLDFKQRMEYYHDNPGLKDGGQLYTAPEAMLELETLLNYTFCHTGMNCPIVETGYSEVVMPLNELSKIADPRLSQLYYEEIIDSIQAQMNRSSLENKKLLLVDLEQTGQAPNGDAIISIRALIGNDQQVVLHNDEWWFGENYGRCNGTHAPEDAASQLAARIASALIPVPPTGCRWYFAGGIESIYIFPTQDPLGTTFDNYLDYKIFYATEEVAPIGYTEKCLSQFEMSFYEGHYINYALNYQTVTNKYFNRCTILGNPYSNPYRIWHEYTIFVGNRFLECSVLIDDILTY